MEEEFDIEKYNTLLRAWQAKVYEELKSEIAGLGIRGKQELLKLTRHPEKIQKRIEEEGLLQKDFKKGRLGIEYGEITSIGFKFPRHGIFEAQGTRNRHKIGNPINAMEWRRPFERNIPELAQKIVDLKAVYVVKSSLKGFNIN